MWRTNLRVLLVALTVVGFYTLVAHVIPQLQSEVPEALALTGSTSPEALVSAGERLYNGSGGCTACHGLGTRAPNLLTGDASGGPIGARCATRRPGLDCKAYLHESMVKPAAFVVPGFEPIMPDMSKQLSEEQIWALIAFLQSQGGDVTVTSADLPKAGVTPAATAAVSPPATPASTTLDPVQLFNEKGCVGCHSLGGKGGTLAPPLDHLGRQRTADYIRRSILFPNADTTKGYEKVAGTMPPVFGQQLTAAQLEALVTYLAGRK